MINQATNRIPYGLLTEEEKEQFCKDFRYEKINKNFEWVSKTIVEHFSFDGVYRLKIEPNNWYYCEFEGSCQVILGSRVIELDQLEGSVYLGSWYTLRPARPDEIPNPEKTLKERIEEEWPDYEVVILGWDDHGCFRITRSINHCHYHVVHTTAQSMKGFAGYVYELDDELDQSNNPTWWYADKFHQPLAVLFDKEVQS